MKHSRFSASSAHRWTVCAGSVQLCEAEKQRPKHSREAVNKDANEGEAAHLVSFMCLETGFDPSAYVGSTISGVTITDEIAEHANVYVEYVRSRSKLFPKRRFERRLESKKSIGPDNGGTADCVLLGYGGCEVVDFKYGRVLVEAENNAQLLNYASLALEHYYGASISFKARLTVVQPRAYHPHGPIRSVTVDRQAVMDFQDLARKQIKLAKSENPPFVVSKQCEFCPARGVCAALRKHNVSLIKEGTELARQHETTSEIP